MQQRTPVPLFAIDSETLPLKGVVEVAYRNKTYVAFASEDIRYYRLMQAWHNNDGIDFNFFDAHDINTARDTSLSETIKVRLRERLSNTKQAVVLVSETTRPKAARLSTFLAYEMQVIARLGIPIVFVNLNSSRQVQRSRLPESLLQHYSVCVSYQPLIIKYALDNYAEYFKTNSQASNPEVGPHYYEECEYRKLGLL